MSDTQTAYELRLLFEEPGCPVCALGQRVSSRYVDSLFYESINDPAARARLRASLGLCYEHAWLLIEARLSDALGQAILYRDLAKTLLERLPEEGEPLDERALRSLGEALTPEAVCPACESRAQAEQRALQALARSLERRDYLAEFEKSEGLCLPHLRALLQEGGLGRKALAAVLRHQRRRLTNLEGELAEFIRKNDYRFQGEGMGAERDAYQRAAAFLTGRRRPMSRKELGLR
ncbi:MAG: DUF6062 family protein [Anaerolineales bacterium]